MRSLTLPILATVVLGAVVVSERITAPPPPGNRIEVTYWEKWTGFEADAMLAVVAKFNRKQDRIHVQMLSISGVGEKTLLATAGGVPPDIAGLSAPSIAQYVDDHALEPLDAYIAQAGLARDQYVAAYWDMGAYHGHQYALPSTPASTALHYNRKMFAAAGLDPNHPPETLEEMDAMVARITRRDAQGRVAVSGFLPSEPGWWNWGWGYGCGGSRWAGAANITANSPDNGRAVTWIQNYSRKYGAGDLQTFRSGFGNFASPQNAFLASKVAMVLQGVWMHNFIDKYSPDLSWGAAAFPHPADRPDLAGLTFVDADLLVIPRGAKQPEAAFEFIRYVQSQEGMELLCMGQRKNSPLRDVSEAFWRNHPNPYIRLFDELPRRATAVTPPKLGIWPEYGSELGAAFDEIALLRKTPQQALDAVQARMQPRLDDYRMRLKARGEAK